MQEPIYVKKTSYGRGVFASRPIARGEKICVMRGTKINSRALEKITQSGRNILVDPLQTGDNSYVNMFEPYVLINHSCAPNAGLRGAVNMHALRDIKKGEEILYDYSATWYEGFECKCGSRKCRRFVGDFFTLPKPTQKKYMKLGIVPDFIKRKLKKK